MARHFSLADAGEYLAWLRTAGPKRLDDLAGTDIYVLVGLASLGRDQTVNASPFLPRAGAASGERIDIEFGAGPVSAFARAVGLAEVVSGAQRREASEPDRSVTLARFRRQQAEQIDTLSTDIARLITTGSADGTVDAIKYVLVEALRNVVQHSEDSLGGVVAAQVIERPGISRRVQVAVGDAGVGILAALTSRQLHPSVADVQTALQKAMHPHFSGTFREGETGTSENAGLGLYVLSELARMTGGSFLLASRGDALLLRDLPSPKDRAVFLDSGGFPGTLVVFECILETLADFKSLFRAIIDKARLQRPGRIVSGVVAFVDDSPPSATRFLIAVASEDTAKAVEFAKGTLLPTISSGTPIALDFRNWSVFSQSYLHALLYVVVRVAWATKTPIYVLHATPVVRSAIEWIESYALVG